MNIIFNNQVVSSNQTISLTKDLTKNSIYQIICASIDSNPDVNISLYDTNSLISLSTSSNSVLQNSCNQPNLCRNILQVNFQLTDNKFDSMTSLTCAANSSNPQVSLNTSISRNVSVTLPRNCLIFILFFTQLRI